MLDIEVNKKPFFLSGRGKSAKVLSFGFLLMAILLVVMMVISLRQANTLYESTQKMYRHPFAVSNAALDAYGRIEVMHFYLADVVRARNSKELHDAITLIELEEYEIQQLFELISERFLGEKQEFERAYDAFIKWGDIRKEIVQLSQEGRHLDADKIFKEQGANYFEFLTAKMYFMVRSAQNKALEFLKDAESEYRHSIWILWLSALGLLSVTVTTATVVVVRVTRVEDELVAKEMRFRGLFEYSEVAIGSTDFSLLIKELNNIRAGGIANFRRHIQNNDQLILQLIDLIKVRHINDSMVRLIGADSEQQALSLIPNIFKSIDIEVYIELLCVIWERHHSFRSEIDFKGLDGWDITAIASFSIPKDEKSFSDIPVSLVDITSRKHAEEALELSASVFTHADEGILITDHRGTIIDCNEAFSDITGYEKVEVIGQNPKMLQSGRHGEEFYQTMWRGLTETGRWRGEIWNRRKDGTTYPEMLTISSVLNQYGEVKNYVAIFSDITTIKQHEDELKFLAHYDSLTGLPNRVLAADRLHMAMSLTLRSNQELVVAYIDLDDFKSVNDSYGHAVGDDLLISVSKRMSGVLREGDTLARIGGDEFVAVFVGLENWRDCQQIIERLLDVVARPMVIKGIDIKVSASIGITHYPQENNDVEADQLYRQADQAMYQAKLAGRNCWRVFDPENDLAIQNQHQLLSEIELALKNEEFVLFYQPKVNMRSGEVVGVEALIRWQHPGRGLLCPDAFLPSIEDYSISVALGEWVISTGLAQLEEWRIHGLGMPMSLNIGAYQLQKSDVVSFLREQLARYPEIKPEQLELEILETSAINDIPGVSEIIRSCKALGVRFALDDFGSGYSSLIYLKSLSVDVLKIDQSFVRDMLNVPEDQAILEGVLGIASSLKIKPIAEGVETEAHGELLLTLGCELAQGYAIARPMPAFELPGWLDNWCSDPLWSNSDC